MITVPPSLAHRNIPRSAYLTDVASSGKQCDKLVIGTAITLPNLSRTSTPQILLVQRAAHEKVLAHYHELLGGHVEDTDVSILEAVARETWEETGLVVEKVLAEIEPLEYSVEKIVAEGEGVQATIVKNTTHLNFIAKISAMDFPPVVTLSHEHESYKWITKRDLVELKESEITGGMKGIVEKALDWTENNASVLHAEYSVTHGEGKTQV